MTTQRELFLEAIIKKIATTLDIPVWILLEGGPMTTLYVTIKRETGFEDFVLPEYSTPGACAMDLRAALPKPFMYLDIGCRVVISTGFSMALPEGYEAQIRPRSGMAIKEGISLVNSPGTIDSDYRGTVGVILINHGHERVKIERGQRIAQMVVHPVTKVTWHEDELPETDRGEGGFGSTGKQ